MVEVEAAVGTRKPHSARQRVLAFTLYTSAGITNALLLILLGVWTEWYWFGAVCFISFFGSLLLIVAAFVSLNKQRTAARYAVLAAVLTWLSLGPAVLLVGSRFIVRVLSGTFATTVTWKVDTIRIIQNSLDGRELSSMEIPVYVMLPVILLGAVTAYSTWASRKTQDT